MHYVCINQKRCPDPCIFQCRFLVPVLENRLSEDLIPFNAVYFQDTCDTSPATGHTGDMNDYIYCRSDLFPYDPERQVDTGH